MNAEIVPRGLEHQTVLRVSGGYRRRDAEFEALRGVLHKRLAAVDARALLAEARPRGGTDRERAKWLAARLAREMFLEQVGETPGGVAAAWAGYQLTAGDRHKQRVHSVWWEAAGIASDESTKRYRELIQRLTTHLKSASDPPGGDPPPEDSPPRDPDTENPDMKPKDPDLITIREKLQAHAAFNISGLPARLRDNRNKEQDIYLDAVIQAVDRIMHVPDNEAGALWSGAVAGLMLLDGHFNPKDKRFFAHAQRTMAELAGSALEGNRVQIDGHTVGDRPLEMFAPDDERQVIRLFQRTLEVLQANGGKEKVLLQSYAHTARQVVRTYPVHNGNEDQVRAIVRSTYGAHISQSSSGGGRPGGGSGVANLDLPPINDPQGFSDEIEPDNIRAVATIYVTYQLEFGLKAVGRILDLFVAGLLPISASDGSARELDSLYWDQSELLDEASRRAVYARVLGAPGGSLAFDMQPNTEFNRLLLRVVSSVSEFEREQSILTHFDKASRGRRFSATSGEFVRKAVRDFAANASLRGWGGTAFTAERMANHVRRAMQVLGLPSVRNAFGVTTPWQVIERVSQREFGATVNTVLHRTLAVETQRIMNVIADHHTIWSGGPGTTGEGGWGRRPLFSTGVGPDGDLPLDASETLMVACQHFRAVAGIGDGMLEEYAAPVEVAAQPSLPDIAGLGAGDSPGIDMAELNRLKDLAMNGQSFDPDQLLNVFRGA